MNGSDFIQQLQSTFQIDSETQVANLLGITQGRVNQMKKETITPALVAKHMKQACKIAEANYAETAIQTIVEFYPITVSPAARKRKLEIIPIDKDATIHQSQLRNALYSTRGIYVFYNSEGKLIYIGKTSSPKQCLWEEMKSAFNRERSDQNIYLAEHDTKAPFHPAHECDTPIRIASRNVFLHDIARFFSAYSVAPGLIHNIEALLIRVTPNNNRNVRMENLKYKA